VPAHVRIGPYPHRAVVRLGANVPQTPLRGRSQAVHLLTSPFARRQGVWKRCEDLAASRYCSNDWIRKLRVAMLSLPAMP
jgi:hypothetical protein